MAHQETDIQMAETHLTETRFDSFDLDPSILQGLADAGFTHCTPIQAETLPIALAGRDVAGQAQTGTGKTAAFLLVVFQRLLTRPAPEQTHKRSHPRALIVAPTRELAVQIHKDTVLLAKHTGFRIGLVFGGTGYQQQRDDLAAGVDILIGTPGRLIDYHKQHVFSLKSIDSVVLDEADRMFDLGFIKDIRFLLRRMPPPDERLGMLFSATLSYRVTELAYEHMNHPQLIKIESDTVTADRVRQVCYMTANVEKVPLLIGLVRGWEDPRVMVFVNTKREADRVWGYLQGNGINTAVLSGDVPQKKRLKLLKHFTDGDMPVLVGTDVAARGLHIPDVTHVVNYDLPEDPEDYVHRIGRTARAGAQGDAVSFVCETYAFCLPDIEAFIGAKVPVGHIESEMLAKIDPRSRLRPDREDREYRHEGRSRHGGHDDRGRGHGPRDSRDGPRRERHPERRHAETRPDTGPAREAAAPGNEVAGSGPEHPHPPRDGRRLEAELPALTTPVEAPHPVTSGDPGVPGTPSTADAPPKKRRRRRRRKPAGDAAGPQPETAVLLQPGGETES